MGEKCIKTLCTDQHDPRPKYLVNNHLLNIDEYVIVYTPYYFVEYDCFSQQRVRQEVIYIESRGVVAINAVDNEVKDIKCDVGIKPQISHKDETVKTIQMGKICEILTSNDDNAKILDINMTLDDVEEFTKRILAKTLIYEYKYRVGHSLRVKHLRPRLRDIKTTKVDITYILFINAHLIFRDKKYNRIFQAVSKYVIHDDTMYCKLCNSIAYMLCPLCGNVICHNHRRKCSKCGNIYCSICITKKGLMFRKYYCHNCVSSSLFF